MNNLHFAVVVGINQYPGYSGGDLNHPRGDAQRFRDWLVDPKGGALPRGNVRMVIREQTAFTSPREAEPTREQIDDELIAIYEQVEAACDADLNAWDRTRLYFFLSGHGLSPGPDDVAVLMANVTDRLLGFNIGCAQYLRFYQEHQPFKEVVLFADCCRTQHGGAPPSGPPFTQMPRDRGAVQVVLGYASSYHRPAMEAPADGKGSYFTDALLDGLNGGAADLQTGRIDVHTLANYVRDRVDVLSEGRQAPEIIADAACSLMFVQGSERPTRRVHIRFPEGFSAPAGVHDSALRRVADCVPRPDQVWSLDLPEGYYRVQRADGRPSGFKANGTFFLRDDDEEVQL